jgi:hypothetical protein
MTREDVGGTKRQAKEEDKAEETRRRSQAGRVERRFVVIERPLLIGEECSFVVCDGHSACRLGDRRNGVVEEVEVRGGRKSCFTQLLWHYVLHS